MLGSFGLAAGLAGALYERALAKQGPGAEVCLGHECYSFTFWTLAGLGGLATVAATALLQKRAPLYVAEFRELRRYDRETQRSEVVDSTGGGSGGSATEPGT